MKKKILVTGAQGFIGSVLTTMLKKNKSFEVIGTDSGFFKSCKMIQFKDPIKIIKSDIRNLKKKYLKNIYAVVHLAALSNDPLGKINKELTYDINVKATLRLAKLSKEMGVKKFIFSSSCIMYGSSKSKKVTEKSKPNPLTEYAKSKVIAEKKISKLESKNFSPIFLRNGTIYGFSPRMRLDTVLNNFIAQAYSNNRIDIFSNGKPFRPVVHVDDVCRIIAEFIKIEKNKIHNQAFNIGDEKLNYRIIDLAKAVAKILNCNINLVNKKDADNRSYIASFDKIKKIFPKFKFRKEPKKAVSEIIKILNKYQISKNLYNNNINNFVRLNYIKKNKLKI